MRRLNERLAGCALSLVLVSGAASSAPAPRRGLTWGSHGLARARGTVLVSCHGLPRVRGGSCNAYAGDTLCTERLPVLCLRRDGSPRPDYAVAAGSEYYSGWAGGRVALSRPVVGSELTSVAAADALCRRDLGSGHRMAEFHDGRWAYGMGAAGVAWGSTWPTESLLQRGGWAFYAYGSIPAETRFWVRIDDQQANCWDAPAHGEESTEPPAPEPVPPNQTEDGKKTLPDGWRSRP